MTCVDVIEARVQAADDKVAVDAAKAQCTTDREKLEAGVIAVLTA